MITKSQVNAIAATIETLGVDENTVVTLRQEYPGIHFTYCMDDDLPNDTPVIEHKDFNLYCVMSREHCLCLTNDYDTATGIVVAEVIVD